MSDLQADLGAALTNAEATVTALQAAQNDVVEDPTWTAVKQALTSNGWSAPSVVVPVVEQDLPENSEAS